MTQSDAKLVVLFLKLKKKNSAVRKRQNFIKNTTQYYKIQFGNTYFLVQNISNMLKIKKNKKKTNK